MTELQITVPTVTQTENLIDVGLLDFAEMLDATVIIDFNSDNTTITTIMAPND